MNSRIGFLVKKKKGNWAYWWCSCKIKKIFRPSSSSSPFQKSAQIDPSQYSQYSFSIPILCVPGVNPTSSLRFSLSLSHLLFQFALVKKVRKLEEKLTPVIIFWISLFVGNAVYIDFCHCYSLNELWWFRVTLWFYFFFVVIDIDMFFMKSCIFLLWLDWMDIWDDFLFACLLV